MNSENYYFISPQCGTCQHMTSDKDHTCAAFPKGIPPEIWNLQVDHKLPYPEDNGIRYVEKSEKT